MPLAFLSGSSLLEGIGIVSTCQKVLNDFQANVFKVDPLIVISSIPCPMYYVWAFAGTRGSTKFEYSFDFLSAFHYFTRRFPMTTWEVRGIVFDLRLGFTDIAGIMDKRKSTIH